LIIPKMSMIIKYNYVHEHLGEYIEMKILVIPDIHLRTWMITRASELMNECNIDRAVCLMDIPDDWDQEMNTALYEKTFDAAIAFAKSFPETLWCWGNHDLSYLWGKLETGYSPYAESVVLRKLQELKETLVDECRLTYVHRIDNVLFSHGGLVKEFVLKHVISKETLNTDLVLNVINNLEDRAMWQDNSPIWARPQYEEMCMYQEKRFLQVVGHTPVERITQKGNIISCDVFSTYRDGTPVGTQEFLIIDTKTWAWKGVR